MNVRTKKLIMCAVIITSFSLLFPDLFHRSINDKAASSENKEGTAAVMPPVQEVHMEPSQNKEVPIQNPKKEIIFGASDIAKLDKYGFKFTTQKQGINRDGINLGDGINYSELEGVTCFRGNNMRNGGSFGAVDVKEGKFQKDWEVNIGAIDSWSGVGWNGQTAIVKWNEDLIKQMNIYNNKKEKKTLYEVIYAALDGYVHFIDLEDGQPTRDKLNIGAPVKGSLTIDPRGYPLMYVGQGIDKNGSRTIGFAYRIFSLIDLKKLYEIKGSDDFALRRWGAFDSTSLIDRQNDFFFLCGENGVVYSGKLNTKYEEGKVSISPVLEKYRFQTKKTSRRGIENSMAIYKNYGFFADNDGVLQCLDLKKLEPVWTRDVNDDTDSTVVLEETNDGLNLYTACEIDHQGSAGYCYVRKLNAANGETCWENKYKCFYDSQTNGGALATPISGKGDMKELVIFNIARTSRHNSGSLIALDKGSGKEVWRLEMANYCWSSPLALYTKEGKGYIVQCDSTGKTFLIEGISGKILDTINLGSNVEGTPAAFNNKIVVGTRGCKIIGFEVK